MQKNMCCSGCLISMKFGVVIATVKNKYHLVLTKKILNSVGFVALFTLDQ